jgi:histone acetyltransferase (RNA polymerase elongator complex component)
VSNQAQKPFIIPVFIPHAGCPHRCAFCNQQTITGAKPVFPQATELRTYIDRYLQFRTTRRSYSQIAFYGGNFLGLSPERVRFFQEIVQSFIHDGRIDGIRFSTRPETITDDRLNLIAAFPVQAVEVGAQSMDDRVLQRIQRGHTAKDTETALRRLKARHYAVGLQVMVGLPGEDDASSVHTGEQVAGLQPDFVRIYPTVVLQNSLLAEWYRQGTYTPLTLQEAVQRSKRLVRMFLEKNIPVVRLGLQHAENLVFGSGIVAGPYHAAFGELVYSELFFDRAVDAIAAVDPPPREIVLKVHPRSVSKMRGNRNINIERLSKRFAPRPIHIVSDPSLSEHDVVI